jgi:hypothetical protein
MQQTAPLGAEMWTAQRLRSTLYQAFPLLASKDDPYGGQDPTTRAPSLRRRLGIPKGIFARPQHGLDRQLRIG